MNSSRMHHSSNTRIAITIESAEGTDNASLLRQAAELAEKLKLPLVSSGESSDSTIDLMLVVTAHRLELKDARHRRVGPVFVDFLQGALGYRRQRGLSLRQPIAKAVGAVGLKKESMTILDATTGLAKDAFILAALGATVTAVERSTVLGELIRDGLDRAAAHPSPIVDVIQRINLVIDDARTLLTRLETVDQPDVIYLDPMYPPTGKTALPKKEMQICRRLVGDDFDAGELLAVARRTCKRRVVVKRHPHAPPLAPNPAIQYTGKQVRFDIYQP